jgi:hypothetical protein
MDFSNTQTHDHSILSVWNTAIQWQSRGVKVILWSQTSPLSEMIRSNVSKMSTLTYYQENSVIIKNAIILIIIHNIFNLRDTEVLSYAYY